MIASYTAVRRILLCIASVGIIILLTNCGILNTGNQTGSGLSDSAKSAASALAIAGFQYVATQALEQQCDQGQSSACKIAYALDPAYKMGKTQDQINATLKAMNDQLADINAKLDGIAGLLDQLASDLNISVQELKLDNENNAAKVYAVPIVSAYRAFNELDYSDNKTPDTAQSVSNFMTYNPNTSNVYAVPGNLDNLHTLIIDDEAAFGSGMLKAMDNKIKANIDDIWRNRPPTYYEAISYYELMEQYFGYLLMQQAKGFVVISASYKYLEKFPDAKTSGSSSTILSQLTYKNFDDYSAHYARNIEDQIKTFLKHVENFIAYTADVDKPGQDTGVASDGSNTDIQGWVSVVLKRADLTAAWARASLRNKVAGTDNAPILLVVRVMGEPERIKRLYEYDGVSDWVQPTPSTANVAWYRTDKEFFKLDASQQEDYRILPARKAYIQFPVGYDGDTGYLKHDRTLIRGAYSLYMNKYILTDQDGITCKTCQQREAHAPMGIYSDSSSSSTLTNPMEVSLVGPDGSAAQPGGPAMYYGHVTFVFKETAARLGSWSHGNAGEITNDSIDNLTHTGTATNTFPQSAQLYVYADPHKSDNKCNPADSACTPTFYAKGHGYYYEQLTGQYYFDGWGDVPEAKRGKVTSTISGKTTHSVTLPASHGSYSMELYYAMTNLSLINSSNSSFQEGNVNVSATSADTWAPNTTIKFFVEPRIKVDWSASRYWDSYGTCTFQGTNKFDMGSLVLQVQ